MSQRLAISAWLVCATTLAAIVPADAQQPIILKLSHFLGPTSFFEVDFTRPWARELERKPAAR
jgi:hypothetical protein